MPLKEDFKRAVELIDASKRILVLTHIKPDGDACGSVAALCEGLRTAGKTAEEVFLSPVPLWYRFLFEHGRETEKGNLTVEQLLSGGVFEPDLIVLVDTNSVSQLGELADYVREAPAKVLVIDHHASGDGLGNVELVEPAAPATGLIILELFGLAGWRVTERVASSLFTAVAVDTGWFRFANADAPAYRAAAELIEAGASPVKLYGRLYENFSPARLKLMAAVLTTVELHFDGRFAVQQLLRRDFKRTGASLADTENLIDECRRIASVEGAGLLVEMPDGRIKCSLRSTGALDVRRIAEGFGGGGHAMAAGAFMPGPLRRAKKQILAAVQGHFQRSDAVGNAAGGA
jgi:phosphoesterase RecJ-like protein